MNEKEKIIDNARQEWIYKTANLSRSGSLDGKSQSEVMDQLEITFKEIISTLINNHHTND